MRQSKVSVHTLRIIINFWEVLVIIGVKNQYLFLILVLFSGPAFADTFHAPGQNEIIEETIYWAEIAVYDVPYSTWHNNLEETISLLLKLNEESLKNYTNPESPIYDPNVLKAYGNVPVIKNTSQLDEFSSTLQAKEIVLSVR